jgi:predicted Kef-type K+ transport protein
VGFLTGISISQISEFSLILAALGSGLGHIDGDGVALITSIALITISLSTYAMLYEQALYERLGPCCRGWNGAGADRWSTSWTTPTRRST